MGVGGYHLSQTWHFSPFPEEEEEEEEVREKRKKRKKLQRTASLFWSFPPFSALPIITTEINTYLFNDNLANCQTLRGSAWGLECVCGCRLVVCVCGCGGEGDCLMPGPRGRRQDAKIASCLRLLRSRMEFWLKGSCFFSSPVKTRAGFIFRDPITRRGEIIWTRLNLLCSQTKRSVQEQLERKTLNPTKPPSLHFSKQEEKGQRMCVVMHLSAIRCKNDKIATANCSSSKFPYISQ